MEPFTRVVMEILQKLASGKSVDLSKLVGPKALATAKQIEETVLNRFGKDPAKQAVAQKFTKAPDAYKAAMSDSLQDVCKSDKGFKSKLEDLTGKYEEQAAQYSK